MFTAIELPQGLWVGVLSHLWQTTIVLAVLALLAAAMRRAPARLLNALWWIGLAKLLVPVQLAAPVLRRAIDPIAAEAQAVGIELEGITVWLGKAAPVLDPAARGHRAALAGTGIPGVALAVLWAVGAVWLVVSLVRARRRCSVRRAAGHEDLPPNLRARLDAALEGTRIPVSVIGVAKASVMPATVGVFRRRIVIPEVLLTRLDTSELQAVLLHEDAHRRRFEPLQVVVQRAATAAFYFFPLLWPLLSKLRDTSEMACDEAAVRRGVAPADYARALARTLSIGLEPMGFAAALARGAPSLTRRRLDRLTHEGRFVPMRRHWLCLAIAALAVIAISASSLALLADEGEPDSEQAKEVPKEKEITKDQAKAIAKVTARAVACGKVTEVSGQAAAVEASQVEQEAAAEEAVAEEAAVEEKTYTITLEHHTNPEYPEDARKDGVGGIVTLKLTLTRDGEVGDVFTLEEVEAYPSFSEAAELAAREWTFTIEGDVEEDLEVIVPIEFKLHGEKTVEMRVEIPDAHVEPDEPDAPGSEDVPEPEEPREPDETPESEEPAEPEAP